jgi:hypothetical protein
MSNWFSPEYQKTFWSQLDPDMRIFLENWESSETWTYSERELPELYSKLLEALPKLAEYSPSPRHSELIRDLIPLLTAMPLRMAVTAVSWLDQRNTSQSYGWGILCLMEASRIAEDNGDPLQADSKAFADRIRVMLRTTLATKLFSSPSPMSAMV